METLVSVEESTERWSEVRLSDGVVLRVKFSVAAAIRTGQFDPYGRPLYNVNGNVMADIQSVPPHLMQGAQDADVGRKN